MDMKTSVNNTESESGSEIYTVSLGSQNSQIQQDAADGNDTNPRQTPEPTGAEGVNREELKTPEGGRRLMKGVIKRTPKKKEKKAKREKPETEEVHTAPGGTETEPRP